MSLNGSLHYYNLKGGLGEMSRTALYVSLERGMNAHIREVLDHAQKNDAL
jgi:hypothetical protein